MHAVSLSVDATLERSKFACGTHVVELGKDALSMFHHAHFINEPFSLILLDINLPEMDGISLLEAIRKSPKSWRKWRNRF